MNVAPRSGWVPDRRDMIWVNFNPGSGQEMKDEHPMLVLTTRAFNDRTGIVIGLPITHAAPAMRTTRSQSSTLARKAKLVTC